MEVINVRRCAYQAVLWLAAMLCLGLARADDALPAETLARVKGATVFIKVEAGKARASGSGFVIRTEGKSAFVVTNNHVIDLTPEDDSRPGAQNPAITVVFYSGTRNEEATRGEVLAADPRSDLAVIKVANVSKAPPALGVDRPAKLTETMPVFILGFPLGQLLATNKGHPAVTVGKGSVASLRNDEDGKLATVQVDGDMTPGNSGGPVLDGEGRLVGVTAATVKDRRIGFAIPTAKLAHLLKGRLLDYHFTTLSKADALDVRVELAVFDPFNQMKSVSFHYVPGGKPSETKLAGLARVSEVKLERTPQMLVGKFSMKPSGTADPKIAFQATYVDGADETFITRAQDASLPRKGGSVPAATRVARTDPRPSPAPEPKEPKSEPKEPKSEPKGQASRKPPAPAAPRGKTMVDLLPLIDTAKDVVHGTWEIKDESLFCTDTKAAQRIAIPYRPPEEYDLIAVFSQPQMREGIVLIMPNPKGGSFWFEIGGARGRKFFLGTKTGGASFVSPKLLSPDTVYTTIVEVRGDSIRCLLNGKQLVNRKTDFTDLKEAGAYELRDATLPGVACSDPTLFHYLRLVEIKGKGSKLP